MAKPNRFMSKKDKKNITLFLAFLVIVFVFLVFLIPIIPCDEVVLGTTPTTWQSFHGWFVQVKAWILENYVILLLLILPAYFFYRIRRTK